MREWNNAAFDAALKTAEKIAGAPLDPTTVEWMKWAFIHAWLSPHGYRYEVRHDDRAIGPVSWDQLIRGRAENKIPPGAEARVVGSWTAVDDLLAGRSLDFGDYESSRCFFEEADGAHQLVQRLVSAAVKLPTVDDALRVKIESDAFKRDWSRRTVSQRELAATFEELVLGSVAGAQFRESTFGDHGFACLQRGALAVALSYHDGASLVATVMYYAFRANDQFTLIWSIPTR